MSNPLILAIETSTRRGSVALGRAGGPAPPLTRTLQADRTHTAELHPAIAALLAEAGVTPREVGVVAFSQGPGSFTGLRVASTLARAWQSATQALVVGVSSLDAIALVAMRHADPPARLAVLVDVRQGRAFAGHYAGEAGGCRRVSGPDLVDVASWLAGLDADVALTGEGVASVRDAIALRGLRALDAALWLPDAADVWALAADAAARGEFLPPHEIVPRYIRRPECEEVYEARRAAAIERRTGGTPTRG